MGERASQKSSLGLLCLGAGQRVGGGVSPVMVGAQMDARSGEAALRERPRQRIGNGQSRGARWESG